MAIPRRAILIFSSVTLILIIALSLSTAIELRAPPTKLIQVAVAQGATDATLSADLKGKGRVNGTGFDRGEIWSGTTEISPGAPPSTIHITLDGEPTATTTQDAGPGEGQPTVIVPLPGQASATSMDDEGYIGPSPTAIPPPPAPPAPPKPPSQLPILALTYTSSGGPKHCRGSLLSKLLFPPPSTLYKNGTCIDLPRDARCGVFLADKNDKCEAQLFNMPNCYNSSETYVNTVVFMPEERPVGALWRSMWVRCGVEVEEPGLIDPSVLGGLLKKPGGKGG